MQGICSENIVVGGVTNMMTASDTQRCSHSLSVIALPVTSQIDTLQTFKCPFPPFHFYLATLASITFKAVSLYVLCKIKSFNSKSHICDYDKQTTKGGGLLLLYLQTILKGKLSLIFLSYSSTYQNFF